MGAAHCRRFAALLAPTPARRPTRANRVSEGGLKALPLGNAKRESLPFTSQAWLPIGGGGGGAAGGPGGESGAGAAADGAGVRDRERQLLGTSDGEILLLEVREWRRGVP